MALVVAHQYRKLHERSAYQYRTSRPSSHDHGQTAQHQRRAATTAPASPAANPTLLARRHTEPYSPSRHGYGR